ncbi:MAG: hypothetical protein RLP02_25985 [Coleofasciculus sp. C2-GNP5-27]
MDIHCAIAKFDIDVGWEWMLGFRRQPNLRRWAIAGKIPSNT